MFGSAVCQQTCEGAPYLLNLVTTIATTLGTDVRVSHVDLLNRRLLTSSLPHGVSWTPDEALGERHDLHSLKGQTGAVIDVKGFVRQATSKDLNAVCWNLTVPHPLVVSEAHYSRLVCN